MLFYYNKIASSKFIYLVYSIGFEKGVEILIEKGASVNAVNKDNNSALIFAGWKGSIENTLHTEFF